MKNKTPMLKQRRETILLRKSNRNDFFALEEVFPMEDIPTEQTGNSISFAKQNEIPDWLYEEQEDDFLMSKTPSEMEDMWEDEE